MNLALPMNFVVEIRQKKSLETLRKHTVLCYVLGRGRGVKPNQELG
jgi:hypothetical protein